MKLQKMLFLMLIAITGALSENAWATCRIFIPSTVFFHESGRSIQFDFNRVLQKKGYEEVQRSVDADHTLTFDGTERVGPRFHFAETAFVMSGIRGESSKMCMTQLCSISDFARSFSSALREFSKNLPDCRSR